MTGTTKPSGTQPPFSCVSSTEKSTRKLAQHAPQVRQGCSDDMGGEDLRTCVGKAKFSLIFVSGVFLSVGGALCLFCRWNQIGCGVTHALKQEGGVVFGEFRKGVVTCG